MWRQRLTALAILALAIGWLGAGTAVGQDVPDTGVGIEDDASAGTVAVSVFGDAEARPVVDVGAGAWHTCALLRDGDVECWGHNDYGQSENYNGGQATDIAVGVWHTCALLEGGNVDCWGKNEAGEADDYTGGDAAGVAAGFYHTCVLLESGNVHCWGKDSSGETSDYHGGDAVEVATGEHTCVRLEDGDVKCWGALSWLQRGQANDYHGGDATDLAVSDLLGHTCIVADGDVDCWGYNGKGQAEDRTGFDAVEVSAGAYHTCALTESGNVKCWGDSHDGQDADYAGGDAVAASAGGKHNCALLSDGTANCWGFNKYGQAEDRTQAAPTVAASATGNSEGAIAVSGSGQAKGSTAGVGGCDLEHTIGRGVLCLSPGLPGGVQEDIRILPGQDVGVEFPTEIPGTGSNCVRVVTGPVVYEGSELEENPVRTAIILPESTAVYHKC